MICSLNVLLSDADCSLGITLLATNHRRSTSTIWQSCGYLAAFDDFSQPGEGHGIVLAIGLFQVSSLL